MATKNIEIVQAPGRTHYVGDGFRVHNFIPGSANLGMERMDPFIMLDYNSPFYFPPTDRPRGVGVHPHRGFETVTFILEGDLIHKDSSGASSVIKAGGVQWMTAGSGLIHSEISSEEFKLTGGPLELLQLWINLPAKHKMTAPKYVGLQREDIPTIKWDNGKVTLHIISGTWDNIDGPVHPLTDINLSWIEFKEGGKHNFLVDTHKNIFCYAVKGAVKINGDEVHNHYLVEFNSDGTIIEMKATTDAIILFGYATPFKEPIVSYGPFVMNTSEEIQQAYVDYRAGKFGQKGAL